LKIDGAGPYDKEKCLKWLSIDYEGISKKSYNYVVEYEREVELVELL